MELSNFPLKNFEPYTSKTKKAIKKNTNLVEITHYVCQSIVFAELSGRPYTRLPFSNSALMASFVRSYPKLCIPSTLNIDLMPCCGTHN